MNARTRAILAAGTTAAALGACHPAPLGKGLNHDDRPVTVAARLVCPEHRGALERVRAPGDGRSCSYVGPDRRAVELKLLPLDGRSAADALRPIEAALRAELGRPAARGPARSSNAGGTDDEDDADPDAPTPRDPPERGRDHVSINLPDVHLDADGSGAHVQALGQTIEATHAGATITGGWNGSANAIAADDRGVEMRLGFAGRSAVDLTLLLDVNRPGPSGASLVGYVARGPAAGPLVLATVVAHPQGSHIRNDFDLKDLRALVAATLSR